MGTGDLSRLRSAIGFYEQAVALDSGFAQAWAELSRAHSLLYANGTPDPASDRRAREGGGSGARAGAEPARGPSRPGRLLRQHPADQEQRPPGVRGRAPAIAQQRRAARARAPWSRSAPASGRRRSNTSAGRRRWTLARSPLPGASPIRCSGCAAIRRRSPRAIARWPSCPTTSRCSRTRRWCFSDRATWRAHAE